MQAISIDHVNLRYPADELEAALEFYCERLGFEPELVGFDDDGTPYVDHASHFSIRLGGDCLIHMTPSAEPAVINRYEDEDRASFDHVAIVVDESIDDVTSRLEEAGVEIHRAFEPGGATGVGPAVFVLDPFGYVIEIKEDPRRVEPRNEEIWARLEDGDEPATIADEFGTTERTVERIATYRRERST